MSPSAEEAARQGHRRTRAFETRMGARIHAARQASGMTLSQLAEAVGVTYPQIQKFERGVDRVSSETIQAIAVALEVPVSSFFDEAHAVEVDPSRGEVLKMAALLMRLPPTLRARLMQLAAALVAGDGKA